MKNICNTINFFINSGNERFISTATGLQIALVQPTDGGKYFCVVRNTFTNQTRRAPRPIILIVEPIALIDYYRKNFRKKINNKDQEEARDEEKDSNLANIISQNPHVVYPQQLITPTHLNQSKAGVIDFHVVAGHTALLECVIWDAKVIWNKADYSLKPISMTDDRARIRQIWGNLRIKQVFFAKKFKFFLLI